MSERNPGATCATCPYWSNDQSLKTQRIEFTQCIRFPKWEQKQAKAPACGEHPDFFKKETSDE